MRRSYYIISSRNERNIEEFIEKVKGICHPLSVYNIKNKNDSDSELFIHDIYNTAVILNSRGIPELGDVDVIGKRRKVKKTKSRLENKTGYRLLEIKHERS